MESPTATCFSGIPQQTIRINDCNHEKVYEWPFQIGEAIFCVIIQKEGEENAVN